MSTIEQRVKNRYASVRRVINEQPIEVASISAGAFVLSTYVMSATSISSFILAVIYGIIMGVFTTLMLYFCLKFIESLFKGYSTFNI